MVVIRSMICGLLGCYWFNEQCTDNIRNQIPGKNMIDGWLKASFLGWGQHLLTDPVMSVAKYTFLNAIGMDISGAGGADALGGLE